MKISSGGVTLELTFKLSSRFPWGERGVQLHAKSSTKG